MASTKKVAFCLLTTLLVLTHTLSKGQTCTVNVVTTPATCSNSSDGTATVTVNGVPLTPSSGNPGTPPCLTPQTSTINCSSGCTQTVSTNTGTVNVGPGQKVCLTASSFTGTIQVTGGTLVVCGGMSPQSFNLNTNGNAFTMIVNGTATFNSLNMQANTTVKNYGTLTINSSSGFNGVLENHGTLTVKGDLSINSPSGQLLNTKILQVQGSFNNFNSTTNGGTLTVTNSINNNSSSALINKCTITVGIDLINNTTITNQGNIQVSGWTRSNGSSNYQGDVGSRLTTTNLQVDGSLQGIGTSCASVKISGQTVLNSSSVVSGAIDICDGNGIETKNGMIMSPATTNCSCQGAMVWNNPLSGGQNPYTGLAPGTYTVTVTPPGCSTVVKTFTITAPPALVVSVTVNGNTATASVSGGTPGYTFAWSGASGTASSQIYSMPGQYTLTVKDSKQCSKIVSFNISIPCNITVVTTPTSCPDSQDGTATITVNGDTLRPNIGNPGTPATCMVPQTSTFNCSSGCNQTVSVNTGTINIAPGQKVCITSSNFTGNLMVTGGTLVICGNATPQVFNLNTNGNVFTLIVNGTATFGSLNLLSTVTVKNYGTITCNGSSGLNGVLENHGTFISKGDFNINSPSGQLLNTNNFQVQGNFNNFNTTTNGGTFTITGNLQNNSGSALINKCQITIGNELINNTSITNQGNIQVATWSRMNGGSSYNGDAGSRLTTSNLIADGTLQGIGTSCASIKISGQTILNGSSVVSGKLDVCDANGIETKNGQIQSPATTNCSCQGIIVWNPPLQGGQNPFTGLGPGTYTVTVSVAGCSTVTKTFTITSPPPIIASVAVIGKTATVTASGGTGTLTYTWSGGTGTGNVRTFANDGTYSVTITDSKNCSVVRTFIIGNPPPEICSTGIAIEATFTSDHKVIIVCNGDCPVVTANGSTLPNGTPISIRPGIDTTIQVITVCGLRLIPVRGGNCAGTIDLTPHNSSCSGSKDGRIDALFTGSGIPTYSWSGPGISDASGSFIQNIGAGSYRVSVTTPTCTQSLSVGITLIEPLPLVASYQATGTNTVNILVSNGTPNYEVKWRIDNKIADSRNDLVPGQTYTVDIKDSKGCTLVFTFRYDLCGASKVNVYVIVKGRTATPVVSGGNGIYSYTWSPITTGVTITNPSSAIQTNLADGDYNLQVSDSKNCTATAKIKVPNCGLSVILSPVTLPSCSTRCDGKASASVTPSSASVLILWNESTTGSNLVNACAGIQRVRVTTSDGCAVIDSIILGSSNSNCPATGCGQNPISVSIKSKVEKKCFSDQSLVDIAVSGGLAPYTFTWTVPSSTSFSGKEIFNSTSEDLINPVPGNYKLTVKDVRGCSAPDLTFTVNGPAASLHASSRITQSPSCAAAKASAVVDVSGGKSPYAILWPDGSTLSSRSDLNPGIYNVSVTDALGCKSNTVLDIPVPVFHGNISPSQTKICTDRHETVTLTAIRVDGYTYSWTGPGLSSVPARSVTISQPGTYTLKYVKAGCDVTLTINITTFCNPHGDTLICKPIELTDTPVEISQQCISQQVIAAQTYASSNYHNYLEEQKRNFKANYINQIMAGAKESLTVEYKDQEFHYTLYYYDRAGNLVQTVPPSGVKILNDQQELQAENDLKNNTNTIFTDHTLTSSYKYNTLDQIIGQDMPDNNRQDLWELSPASISLSPGQQAAVVGYSSATNGVLIANTSTDAGLYTTSDGGVTWTKLENLGLSDLLDIQKVNSTTAFAAGKKGVFLASQDGGQTWIIKSVPTTENLIKVNFTSATAGLILSETGSLWTTTNAGTTWSTEITSLRQINPGLLKDAWFDGSTIWTVSQNSSGSHIWNSTNNGTSWTEQSSFRPCTINNIVTDASNYMLAGPVGSLFTLNGANTVLTRTNLGVGISQVSKTNGFAAIGQDARLYSGDASGTQWSSASTQTGVRQILNVPGKDIYITSDGRTGQGAAPVTFVTTITGLTQVNKIRFTTKAPFTGQTAGSVLLLGNVVGYKAANGNFNASAGWTTVTINNLPAGNQVKDAWVVSPGQWVLLTTSGTVHTASVTTGNTLQASAAILTNIFSLYPFDAILYALNNGGTFQSTTNGSIWSAVSVPSLPAAVGQLLDLNLQTGTPVKAVVSFTGNQLWQLNTAGNAWTDISRNMKPSGLNAIQVRNSDGAGDVAGNNGEIFAHNGTNWDYQAHSVLGLNFIDLFLAADNTLRLASTNKVYTYSSALSQLTDESLLVITGNVTELDIEGTNVLAGTDAGGLFLKSGSGVWTSVFNNPVPVFAVEAEASGVYLASGQNGAIFIRNASTGVWSPASPVHAEPLAAIAFGNSSFAVAVGKQGTIITSADGGQSWTPRFSGTTTDLVSVTANGSNIAIVGAVNGTLLFSTNGGQTWQTSSVNPSIGNIPVSAVRTGNGTTVLAIAGTRLIKSVNGGSTFQNETGVTLSSNANGLWLDADGYGFIVGDQSLAFRIQPTGPTTFSYTSVATDANITDDKGTGIPVGASLRTVQFSDRLTGYITGTNGLVLKTIDGGQHWKTENGTTGTGTPIVTFSDGQHGSLIGADGSINTLRDRAEKVATRFWYDEVGRAVLSQNSKQFNIEQYNTAADNQAVPGTGTVRAYNYTLYDPTGRVIEIGELLTRETPPVTKYESQIKYNTFRDSFVPNGVSREITKTYYDEVKYPGILAGFEQENLRPRPVSVTYQDVEGISYDRAIHYSYDVHGNAKTLVTEIAFNGNQLTKRIDYEYDLLSGKLVFVYYQKNQSDQFVYKYLYDADNRLVSVNTSRDGIVWEKDASYQYYAHGPLARKELGEQKVETCDYAYTLQGWAKGVKGQNFSYGLGYYSGDYTSINNGQSNGLLSTPIATGRGLFNGNIATMTTNTPSFSSPVLTQQFEYDQLNWINASKVSGGSNANSFKTTYAFDPNGNFTGLQRFTESGSTLDQLTYNYELKNNSYQHNTNKLRWVDDAVTTADNTDLEDQNADNYEYDDVGNIKKDIKEGIDKIEWNAYGKIKRITRNASSTSPDLEFGYDGNGKRIAKKIISKNGDISTTFYLRDATGQSIAIYKQDLGNAPIVLSENLIFGNRRIGISRPDPSLNNLSLNAPEVTYAGIKGNKEYEVEDHLGNVRVVLNDLRQPSGVTGVIAATEYYPFGMIMPGRQLTTGLAYRYGFNGMEKDDEIHSIPGANYDFNYRIYDTRLGRFFSVDPQGNHYPWNSTYAFAENRVIDGVDLEGMEYCPYIPKYQYQDNWQDYVKAVDNGMINVVNLVPALWNSGVATVQSASRGTYLHDLGGELKQMGTGIKNEAVAEYNYTVNTPVKQQLKDAGNQITSPEYLENVTTLLVTELLPGSAAAVKAELKTAVKAELKTAVKTELKAAEKAIVKETPKPALKVSKAAKAAETSEEMAARYKKSRPTYRKGVVQEVWDAKKDVNGKVFDPSGKELTWNKSRGRFDQWHMGHIEGKEYEKLVEKLRKGEINQKQFLDEYNNPKNYIPEDGPINMGRTRNAPKGIPYKED